jgi:hypothetical protein
MPERREEGEGRSEKREKRRESRVIERREEGEGRSEEGGARRASRMPERREEEVVCVALRPSLRRRLSLVY